MGKHTQEDMLEHAIRLNLIQWGLKQTLFIHIIFFVISERAEFPSLLVEEVKVSGTLISNITIKRSSSLSLFLIPLNFTVPVIVLVVIFKVVIQSKVRLPGGILAF